MYDILQQMKKGLTQMNLWFDKAKAHAQAKRYDVNVLATMRLAPDQFPLTRQVQSACDSAKFAGSRPTGKEAPRHEDTETTIEQLQARIASTLEWLETITPEDYAGASERMITTPRWGGKHMLGNEYFVAHALPNYYFHLTHTYAILRHAGVDVGKLDYLGPLPLRD